MPRARSFCAKHLLGGHGLAVDDVENLRLTPGLHNYPIDAVDYTLDAYRNGGLSCTPGRTFPIDAPNPADVYIQILMNSYSSPCGSGWPGPRGTRGRNCWPCSPATPRRPLPAPCLPVRFGREPLPRLARVWDGEVEPLNAGRLAREVDVVFLAVPEEASAELGAAARRGRRARDRSVGRVPHSRTRRCARAGIRPRRALPAGRRVRTDRALPRRRPRARARGEPRLLSDGGAALAAAAREGRPARRGRRRRHRREVRASRARAARRAIARTSPRTTDRCAAYGVFGHRHVAEMEQELGAAVTFVPHLVPLDRGILETIYVTAGARRRPTDRIARRARARPTPPSRSCGSRATRCRRSSTSRGPTSATSAGGSSAGSRRLVIVVVHRQSREGRGRPGAAELQRRLRLRRADGACCDGRWCSSSAASSRDADARAAHRRGHGRARRATATARRRARRRPRDRRGAGAPRRLRRRKVDGLRITDAATLDVVVSRARRLGEHGTGRGARRGRRAARSVSRASTPARRGRAARAAHHVDVGRRRRPRARRRSGGRGSVAARRCCCMRATCR